MSNQSGNEIVGGEEMQNKEESPDQKYLGSVLLADRIQNFVNKGWLIQKDTFDKGQLRRAKYDVRLGKVYYKAGDYGNLSDDKPLLVVEPYELVFVESYEVFDMPMNVVAVYDLRISGCLGGLGLQTGLQLDPTYHGRFFCPLFNFSDTRVMLRYKRHLASVQFVYTTPSTPEAECFDAVDKKRQELLSLSDALPDVIRQSGLQRLWTDIKEAKTRVETMVTITYTVIAIMFAVLGVTLAAISITLNPESKLELLPITISVIGLAGIALLGIGAYAFVRKIWSKIFKKIEKIS